MCFNFPTLKSVFVVAVLNTYHKPGRRHWLEQRGHKAEEAGGERSRSVSGSVQKAWPGTAAREVTPVQEGKVHVTTMKVSGRLITATTAQGQFINSSKVKTTKQIIEKNVILY